MFDANVVLDVLLRRQPFAEPSGQLLSRAERDDIQGYICASVVTTIFYLARKRLDWMKLVGKCVQFYRFWMWHP